MQAKHLLGAVSAFLMLSVLASSTYVLNDILDVRADRKHRIKHNRPIARGHVSILQGIIISLVGIVGVLVLCAILFPRIFPLILTYLIVTLGYSVAFKKIFMLDVITLSFLYTVRIIIGSVAIEEVMSEWLFSFSIFLFSSLGFVKRYSEIFQKDASQLEQENQKLPGRSYFYYDKQVIQTMGISLGMCAVLIFVLYINSDRVRVLYEINYWLWLIAPIMLYWLGRLWILTSRGEVHEDPIVFSLRDRVNYVLLLLVIVCVALSKEGVNVL